MAVVETRRFGKYEIIEELGRGGMGVVYKALDPVIGRLVALKTLISAGITDPELLKRFYREAQAAGRLTHPNIVTIYDMGESGGRPYIAMEFLEGESLEKLISRREPVPVAEKLDIILQFCRGLGFAHQHNVVHRDVKPANIFIKNDGTVKVVDFGIVRLAATTMTHTGMVIGTVPYMSPEQVSGEHVDTRSDIFSVGTVAYEFLTCRKPFDGPNLPSIMFKIVHEKPAPPSQLVPDIPPQLESAILRCFEQRPDDRYQALEDLVLELEPLEYSLKRQRVSQLVEQGQELYQQKDFSRAKDVLRNVLLLDSSQGAAKELLAKVNSEIRRLEVSSRVDRLVEEARQLVTQGKHSEASRSLEEALRLDSRHGEAQRLLADAQRLAERDRLVQEALSTVHAALGQGNLTLAEAELSKLVELQAGHHEIQVLQERIAQARAREHRIKVQKAASFSRHLLLQERHEEALQELERLRQEFPGEAEIEQLFESAQGKLQERQRRREVEGQIADLERLAVDQEFSEGRARLERLKAECAGHAELAELYERARERFDVAVREQRREGELAAVQELIRQEQYATAVERAEALRLEYPESMEAQQLVEFARSLQETAQQQQEVAAVGRFIQSLTEAGRLTEAVQEAEKALESFPQNRAVAALAAAARQAQSREAGRATEERLRHEIAPHVTAIEQVLADKNYTGALRQAEELARRYPGRTDVRRLLERVRTTAHADEKKQVLVACQTVQALLDAREPERAVEEARNALRDFPGNTDLTALWMEAKKQQREQAAVVAEEQAQASAEENASATAVFGSPARGELAGSEAPRAVPAQPRGAHPRPATIAKPSPPWKRQIRIVIAAAVIAAVAVTVVHFASRAAKPSAQEVQLADLAARFRAQGNWEAALDTLKQLQALHGASQNQATTEIAQIGQARQQENDLFQQAQAAQNQKNWDQAIQLYSQVINLNGEYKQQAIRDRQDIQSVEQTIRTGGGDQQQAEATAFERGESFYRQKNFDQAQRELQKVVMLNLPGSKLVPRAQARLEDIKNALEANEQEARQLFDDASRRAGSNDVNVLQKAVSEFQQVVSLHSSLTAEAETRAQVTSGKIAGLVSKANDQKQRQQALSNTSAKIQADLAQHHYADALALVPGIRQLGGNAAGVQGQIAAAYETEFKQLQDSYIRAKAAKDLTALVQVATNLGDLKARAGSLGGDTQTLANQVQAAIQDLSTRPAQPPPQTSAQAVPSTGSTVRKAPAAPQVTLDVGGAYRRYPGRVDAGKYLAAFYIDGGLKPAGGSLRMPPVESATSGCFVTYIIRIDTSGSVHPDHAELDKCGLGSYVEEAAQHWKFEPPTAKGKPVQTSVMVKVVF